MSTERIRMSLQCYAHVFAKAAIVLFMAIMEEELLLGVHFQSLTTVS